MAQGYGGGRPEPSRLPACLLGGLGVCFLTGARHSQPGLVVRHLGTSPVWIGLGRLGDGYCA
jgi:hypothetical protein